MRRWTDRSRLGSSYRPAVAIGPTGARSGTVMTTPTSTETLIIGAGPAGLAVGACLRQSGRPFTILEARAAIGASWQRHYDRLHLHTAARYSALPYLDFPPGIPRYPSREQVFAYLQQYAQCFGLEPKLTEDVCDVSRRGEDWVTTTSGGNSYRSRSVVVASGCNATPNVPAWPGQERFRGPILHSSDYRNGEPFRGQRVLVVGLGNSGGEIAVDLHEHGALPACAVRAPVNIVPREICGLPILTISLALARLPTRIADILAAPLLRLALGDLARLGLARPTVGPFAQIRQTGRIPLIDVGTVQLVREGRIDILRGVRSLAETTVTFDDGSSREFDAIVLATGYRSGTARFLRVNASLSATSEGRAPILGREGLYFCGFNISATGMFREIAVEARAIAARIGMN
jgi:indole-3-pyruvate monooxygenase